MSERQKVKKTEHKLHKQKEKSFLIFCFIPLSFRDRKSKAGRRVEESSFTVIDTGGSRGEV